MSNASNTPSTSESIAKELQSTLVGAAALAGIGLFLAWFAYARYEGKIEQADQSITTLGQSERRVDQLTRDVTNSITAIPSFKSLQQQNIVGSFNKTAQADQFEQLATDHPGNVLSFALGGFEELTTPSDLVVSGLVLGRHELTFESSPRHEIHLLSLLDKLAESELGLPLLKSCSVTKAVIDRNEDDGDDASKTRSSLRARCAVDWYVFDKRNDSISTGAINNFRGEAS